MNGVEEAPKRAEPLPLEAVLLKSGHPEKAVEVLNAKLKDDPTNWQHHVNIGIGYRMAGQFLLAMLHQKLSTDLKPNSAATWHNLSVTESELGDFDSAFIHEQEAYKIEPHKQPIVLGMAYALMREAKFELAWPLWEEGRYHTSWWELPGVPVWDGEASLEGKRLLVMKEGGYGDAIMFLRWFPDLKARGAHISFLVWDRIMPLFKGHPWLDEVIPASQSLDPKDFDYCTSLMSLPALLHCKPDAIPMAPKYIMARPEKIEQWKGESGRHPASLVGLCWKAEENGAGRKMRSMTEEEISPLEDRDIDWISLVPGASLPWMVQPAIKDWGDTAAIVDRLDAVVSVDTAVAHLAAAMGKPTYVIVPVGSDWKWFRRLVDSPWYPSMKVIHNEDPLSFAGAIEIVKTRLNAGR